MGRQAMRSGQLAARLADRLCHDVLGSSQALASGLDLLREASTDAAREEALEFLAEGLSAQRSRVLFARDAFGPGGEVTTDQLHSLVENHFADLRPDVEWDAESMVLGPTGGRLLLNLAQIAAECLALGGAARVSARASPACDQVVVEGRGARVVFREETRAGLAGEPFGEGLGGRWAQAALVHVLAVEAGGSLEFEADDGLVRVSVNLPAGA
jgi:histidine phosphotransferase ChpT